MVLDMNILHERADSDGKRCGYLCALMGNVIKTNLRAVIGIE